MTGTAAEPGGRAAHAARAVEVLLAGNPNAGKTTVFNSLSGARARVANYPGVTVDRRSTELALPSGRRVTLVDLPGTYSLSARSPEEQIAADAVLGRRARPPDAVAVIADACSLARNLYLCLQIAESGVPVVLALNMMDEARAAGIAVDEGLLAERIGVRVVPMVASRGEGRDALLAELDRALDAGPTSDPPRVPLPDSLAVDVAEVEAAVAVAHPDVSPAARRAWAMWSLLSIGDDELAGVDPRVRDATAVVQARATDAGRDLDLEIIAARYAFIDEVVGDAVTRGEAGVRRTERIDRVLTHPLWGFVIFGLVMYVVFEALFSWSEPAIGLIEDGVGFAQGLVESAMPAGPLRDLLVEGVVAGVGNVVVFVPQIALLFLFIGFLEDSGYLARVAFVIDRLMKGVGLHGKAFVPLLSGFACAIPAVMATRTIESRRDRLVTMLALPLMSCSARLPVYVLVIATVFAGQERVLGVMSVGAVVLLGMYLLSVVATLGAAAVLRRTVLDGPRPALVLELPPYRMPLLRNLLSTTWQRVKSFLVDAGTIILALTIVMWALLSFPHDAEVAARFEADRQAAMGSLEGEALEARLGELSGEEAGAQLRQSVAGRIGRAMEPAIEPLGFDWRMGVGILGAFAAREVFVSTMGIVFGIAEADEESAPLRGALTAATWPDGRPLMTPLAGVSLMVFFVLACQCMSTIAVVRRESGSWRWPLLMLGYMTALAYVASLLVYQVGAALGWGLG